MKNKFISLMLLCVALSLAGCTADKDTSTSSRSTSEIAETSESIAEETTEEVTEISYEVAAEDIAPFQGEWRDHKLKGRKLIVSGQTVNFIYINRRGDFEFVENVHTFYFEYNNNELVVCNQYHQPRYVFSINDDGQIQEDDDGEITLYDYVSDNTVVPVALEDPAIGMTEDELNASSWGIPKKRNITETATTTREQWVYDRGYVYLENGIVTTIQKR